MGARPGNFRVAAETFQSSFLEADSSDLKGRLRETGCALGELFKSADIYFWMAVRTQNEYQGDMLST